MTDVGMTDPGRSACLSQEALALILVRLLGGNDLDRYGPLELIVVS